MADQVTEIYKGNHAITELFDGGIDVITGLPDTRYVIKDVQIIYNQVAFPLSLKVDGFEVANGSNNLSGSEIVQDDVNVSVSTRGEYTDYKLSFWDSATDIVTIDVKAITGTPDLILEEPQATKIVTATTSGNPDLYPLMTAVLSDDQTQYVAGGWDENTQSGLWKINASTGARIQKATLGGYNGQPTSGGDGFFYYYNTNAIYRMPVNGGGGASIVANVGAIGGNSTYPLFSTNTLPSPDGLRCFVLCPAGNGPAVNAVFVDEVTLEVKRQHLIGYSNQGFWSGWAAGVYACPFYDELDDCWKILYQGGPGTVVSIGKIPEAAGIAEPLASPFLGGTSASRPIYAGGRVWIVSSASGGEFFSVGTNLDDKKVHATGAIFATKYVPEIPISVAKVSTPSPGEILGRNYLGVPSVEIRVTGIKST